MDGERKIHLGLGEVGHHDETDAANIFLNTDKNSTTKTTINGNLIHLKTERSADVGVHINTTLSIASSKKIRLLFMLNFLLSIVCMVISCSVAFYYWNEMISMRRQLDTIKDQFIIQSLNNVKVESSPLVSKARPHFKGIDLREPRMESGAKIDISPNARRYFVEDLGEDMVLVDSSKKNPKVDNAPVFDISIVHKEPVIAHFNGALRETNLGTKSVIGPWARDLDVSSENSKEKFELKDNYVVIKEGGLYLVYAQVAYLTKAPNCFLIWARQPGQDPRLLSMCATGDDSTERSLDKSQMSCSVQTVARLQRGDTINLAQREHNRTLWLRPGYTYIGFVKLSS